MCTFAEVTVRFGSVRVDSDASTRRVVHCLLGRRPCNGSAGSTDVTLDDASMWRHCPLICCVQSLDARIRGRKLDRPEGDIVD